MIASESGSASLCSVPTTVSADEGSPLSRTHSSESENGTVWSARRPEIAKAGDMKCSNCGAEYDVTLYLPVVVKGVLLPINGQIVDDGLLSTYRITFGRRIRRSLNADFKRAKET